MNRYSWLRMAGLLLVVALLATSFGVALAAPPAEDTDPPETTVRFRGDVVRLTSEHGTIELPVYVHHGVRPGAVAVPVPAVNHVSHR